jgi:SAM-dependent methyltransferase
MSEWSGYTLEDYSFDFEPGSLVLDVGCGYGRQMQRLNQRGCSTIGIDLDASVLSSCRRQGLCVLKARAEQIPIESGSLDGIICKVVILLTEEGKVIREIGRLLKPGAKCYLVSHGAGYYLKYLLFPPVWKHRLYALRTLVNTWLWVATGRRLPGFFGDTIYQSRRRLSKYFRGNGLALLQETPSEDFLGFPVFIYQIIEKISVLPTESHDRYGAPNKAAGNRR